MCFPWFFATQSIITQTSKTKKFAFVCTGNKFDFFNITHFCVYFFFTNIQVPFFLLFLCVIVFANANRQFFRANAGFPTQLVTSVHLRIYIVVLQNVQSKTCEHDQMQEQKKNITLELEKLQVFAFFFTHIQMRLFRKLHTLIGLCVGTKCKFARQTWWKPRGFEEHAGRYIQSSHWDIGEPETSFGRNKGKRVAS